MLRAVDLVPRPRREVRAGEERMLMLELSRIADRLAVLAARIDDRPEVGPGSLLERELSGAIGRLRLAVAELSGVAGPGCDAPPCLSTGGASQSPSGRAEF